MAAARELWRSSQPDWDPDRLVFLDETGVDTKLTRRYGRAPTHRRCIGRVPHGHWRTLTFVAALRQDALMAPWVLDGPMSGVAFLAYLGAELAKILQPGDKVICDNLSCHKVEGVRAIIEAAGAELIYLPPYSPDLNPIEMAFAKFKAHLRKCAARSHDQLLSAVRSALQTFTPQDCKAFFKHAQYASD